MASEIRAFLKEAKRHLDEEKFQDCINVCLKILVLDEKCYNGLVIYGAALVGVNKMHEASQELDKATVIDPNSPLAWQGLGKVYESEKMLSRLKRSRICDVYRKLCGFYSTNDSDWLKLAKAKCMLAKALVFDFVEADLTKEDSSMCIERLREATNSLKDTWSIASKRKFNSCDFSPIFSLFIQQLRRICAVDSGNLLYQDSAVLLKDVYFQLFQLERVDDDSAVEPDNQWYSLLQLLIPQDVSAFADDCATLVVKSGLTGDLLESTIWRLIQVTSTPKVVLIYSQLLLEKNMSQPQIAKVRQLANEEHSVLKAEYQRQTGSRLSSISKFECDTLHLVFGALALHEGNKARALEELSSIEEPQNPVVYAYLAKANLECGMPAEAAAAALQGLKLCSSDAAKKKGPSLFSCFFDKRIVTIECDALRILALLECGTEPSYASLVQEVDDLISQEEIARKSDTIAYLAGRLHASSLSAKKHDLQIRDNCRKLEVEMRHFISNGSPETALELYDNAKGIQGAEDDIFLLTMEALACSLVDEIKGDFISRGTTAATRALAIGPRYAPAHWAMGRCLLRINQVAKAEEHLAEACSSQPLNSSIAYDYCKILFSTQRHKECADIVSRLVSVSSPFQWPYIRLALYYLEQKNSNPAIHLLLAALRCPLKVSEAVDATSLGVTLSKSARLATLWRCLGSAYIQKGSLASATRALNHCASLTETKKFDATSATSIADAYIRLGRVDAVVRCLEEESEPSTNSAVNVRKFIQIATAELHEAKSNSSRCQHCVVKKSLRALNVLFERTSSDAMNVSLFWKVAGDAAMLLADAIEHIPPSCRPILNPKASALLKLQTAPTDQNDWLLLACRFYSTAIRINGSLPQLWSDLSIARSRLAASRCEKSTKAAISSAFVSAQLFPCQTTWCNIGLICVLLGKYKAAQHFFLSCLPNATESPLLLLSMGLLYMLAQNAQLAVGALSQARKLVDAGSVESVTKPNILPALQIAEASLSASAPIKMKHLIDLIQLAASPPASAGLPCRLAIVGLLLRKVILAFSTMSVTKRNNTLSCRILFEQLGPVVDNCVLLCDQTFDEDSIAKSLRAISGLCGHVLELSPGATIAWSRSARLFEKGVGQDSPEGLAFLWHYLRAQCLASRRIDQKVVDQVNELSANMGDQRFLLASLAAVKSSSSNSPNVVGEAYSHLQSIDLAIAVGLAYAMTGSYAAAKEHLLKILIGLKSQAQAERSEANEAQEWRLLGILGKIAAFTKDAQLHAVVLSLCGPSLSSELLKLLSSPHKSVFSASAAFVHMAPYRSDAWQFALRHLLTSSSGKDKKCNEKQLKMLGRFLEVAIPHLPPRDACLWRAAGSLLLSPEDSQRSRKLALAAIHTKPFEAGTWGTLLAINANCNLLKEPRVKEVVDKTFRFHNEHTKTFKLSFNESSSLQ